MRVNSIIVLSLQAHGTAVERQICTTAILMIQQLIIEGICLQTTPSLFQPTDGKL